VVTNPGLKIPHEISSKIRKNVYSGYAGHECCTIIEINKLIENIFNNASVREMELTPTKITESNS